MFYNQDEAEYEIFKQNFDVMFPNKNFDYYSEDDELPINTFNHIEKSINRRKIDKDSKNIIAHVLMNDQRIHEDYLSDNISSVNFINSVLARNNHQEFKTLIIVPPNANLNDAINKLRQNSLHFIPKIWEVIIFGGFTIDQTEKAIPLQKIMSNDTSLPCLDPFVFTNLQSDVLENKTLKISILGRNEHYKEYLRLLKEKPRGLKYEEILNKILPILDHDQTLPFVKDYSVFKDIFVINKLKRLEINSIFDSNKFIDQDKTILNIYLGKLEISNKKLLIEMTDFKEEEKKKICLEYCQLIFKETELHNYMGFIEDLFNQKNKIVKQMEDNQDNEMMVNLEFNYPKFNLKLNLDNTKVNQHHINEKTLLDPIFNFLISK